MNGTHGPRQPPPDYPARCQLALSLINHRQPTERLLDLVRMALEGATVQDLVDVERGQ
jgi:hypothetical protein